MSEKTENNQINNQNPEEQNIENIIENQNPLNNEFPAPPSHENAIIQNPNFQNENNQKSEILKKMESLQESIYISWLKDLDKVNEIIECHNLLSDIINKCEKIEDIENYFNNNQDDFDYFINTFTKQVIQNILRQNIVYGENGEDKAFDVLIDYLKIFLKFILNHNDKNNIKLFPLIEYIKEIFDDSKSYYKPYPYLQEKNPNSKKFISYQTYNEMYLKKKNNITVNDLKENEEIDVLIPSKERFYNNVWSRGTIISIDKEKNIFLVKVLNNDEPIIFSITSFDYDLKGKKTLDWDWRLNLKEGEIIDCYERKKIYPSTIIKRIEKENYLEYNVSFRIYLDSIDIKNIDKYNIFWPSNEIKEEDNRKYIGDDKMYDEIIPMTSKRLFPKDTKLCNEEINLFDDDLDLDFIFNVDNQVEDIDLFGKKTITIGRSNNFEYYFNLMLNEFGYLNGFDKMLKFIEDNLNDYDKDKKNDDIIIMLIFSIFKIAFPFLYKPLFLKYFENLSKNIYDYVNNLSNQDLRNVKKETIDLMLDLIRKYSSITTKDKNSYIIETISLNFAIKMLKTDYLDKRTSAIKSISDIIKLQKYNDDFKQKLIDIIKDNNIIYEIYGPNSHIQLVRNSKELIEILLTNNKLSEEELNLIWNGTKTGDLDEKKTIIKILNEILSSNFFYDDNNMKVMISKILNFIIKENTISNDISEDEIDLIFNLINKLNDDDIEKYINYLIDFIKENSQNSNIHKIILQIYELSKKENKLKINLINQAFEFIKDERYLQIGYNILIIYINTSNLKTDNDLLIKDDKLLNLYKNSFDEYYNNKDKINKNMHEKNIKNRIKFLNVLIRNKIWNVENESPIDFVYKKLVLNKYDKNDEKIFYQWLKDLMKEKRIEGIEEIIFKLFTENDTNNNLSIEGFETFLNVFTEINKNEKKLSYDNSSKTLILENNYLPKDLTGFSELKKIIFENNNNEIINKGIDYLNKLFNTNRENLVDLCLEEIKNSNNNIEIMNKCISILSNLIYLNEENGTGDIIPCISMVKSDIITVHFEIELPHNVNIRSLEIKTYSNSTFYSLKNQLSKILNYHYDFMKFELIDTLNKKESNLNKLNENQTINNTNIELTRKDNGKTLKSLNIKNNSTIKITSNDLEKKIKDSEILNNENEVSLEALKIFNEWFDKYSTNNKMDSLNLSHFVRDVTNSKEEVNIEDIRVTELMNEKDSNHDGFIEREEFINWYVTSTINRSKLVLDNIKAMGYRGDLKKISDGFYIENKGSDMMLRYILGNNFNLLNILFNGMNNGNENLNLFNFIIGLCVNNVIYNEVLNVKNIDIENFNWEDLVMKNGNLYYFCYICFIVEYFIENANDNDDFKLWIKKFILGNGYLFFINVFIKEMKCVTEKKDNKENIDIVCFKLLIKIIKQIYLCSIEVNNENEEFNQFLNKENLISKIHENFINKEMFNYLMNVIDNCINEKLHNNIINEIIQLITILIPNIDDISNNDKIIELILNGLKSEKEETRKIFIDAFIRMSKILISKDKYYILSNLFEKILQIFNNDNCEVILNDKLCECFTYLLVLYNENKEKFKLRDDFDIVLFGEKIRNEINNELTINYLNPKISDDKLVNDLIILSKLIEINETVKKDTNEKSDLFNNILKKIIFYSDELEEKNNKHNIEEINTNNNIEEKENENEKENDQIIKMEFINLDTIQKLKNINLSSNIKILNSSYILISSLLKNNLKNFITYLKYQNLKKNKTNSEMDLSRKSLYQCKRKELGYVGLKNLGCICYMNSTMQQFFMIPTLRYTVLKLNDNKKPNFKLNNRELKKELIDDNMFHQLQKLFSYLLLSERIDYNPYGFTYSFKDFDGNPTKLFEQKDTQEFLAIFLDRLEQSSKVSEYKYMISNIFGGKNCSLITCLECGYVSYKYEPSVFLSLEVKNMKNLNDSLDKYINEEFIDGYECNGCKKRCKISKRNILSNLPNVCIIHLQRLYYNWEIDHNEKINSRLEFPKKINLKNYTLENILKSNENKKEEIYFKSDEYYNYYLVGVVVHLGSADSGHYYSYINTIRDGNGNISNFNPNDDSCLNSWIEFNDSTISKFDISHLEDETFGGSNNDYNNNSVRYMMGNGMSGRMFNWNREKCKNAYLLVYERLVKSPNIIKILNVNNIDKDNLIEFNEDDKNKIFKEYDTIRFYNKNDLSEYNNKCNELYNKVFHNVTNDEYFKFEPFYNYINKRLVPKIYYDEIINDNKNFEKIINFSESQFTNFNNKIIDLLEETSINNIDDISIEDGEIIINEFLHFIVNNISNKNNKEFLPNGCRKLINVIEKKKELFKDIMLKFLNENTEQIKRLLKYESNDIIKEFNDLQEKIYTIYDIKKDNEEEEDGTELHTIN